MFDENNALSESNLRVVDNLAEDAFVSKIAFTVVGTCASGDHWTVDASVGSVSGVVVVHSSECDAPITAEELPIIVRYLLRAYRDGKSAAQLKTGAQAGITVNV